MTGINLGDFTVGVIPQLTPQQLRAELQQGEQIAKRMPLRVPVKFDDASLKGETRRLTAELQKGATLKLKLDTSTMPAELKRIQQQLGRAASIRVQVKDSGTAINDLKTLDRLLKGLGTRTQYRVTVNTSALEAVHSKINVQVQQLTTLLRELRAAGGMARASAPATGRTGTASGGLPSGTQATIREIERLNNLWTRGQISAENYNSALTAMQGRLRAAATGAARGSSEFAQIDRALTRVSTSLRSIRTDNLLRIRADAAALRTAFDSATAGVKRNSAEFRQAAQTYAQGAQQLETRLQSLTRQAQLTPQQLRQVNQQLAQLAREQNTIAGGINHAGLSGNIVNAGGALGAGAGAGLTMMGGGLGMVAAQGAMVASAMTNIYQTSGKAGLALGGVGLAAMGTVAALGSLGSAGLSEVKKLETATNILKANGAPNIAAFEGQLDSLKSSLGSVGDSFTKGDFGLATADIVKAGVESADALTLMTSSTKLAAAEQINLTEASGLLLKNLRQYGYEVEDAARVGDMLAMAGNAAAGSAYDLSVGLGIVGGTGKAAKVEMYDLLGMLVELDNKGMSAADVGANGLRAALSALSDITKKGQGTLAELGIAMVDTEGKARPAGDIMKDLGEKMRGMGIETDKQTGELIGNGEALKTVSSLMDNRAAAAVINLTGEWETWSQQIKDSDGYLDQYATTMSEGVETALKGLKNAWADTGAEFAKAFAGPMTTFLNETLNPFVKKLGEMFEILGKGNDAEIRASLKITPDDNGTTTILKLLTGGAYQVASGFADGGIVGAALGGQDDLVNRYRASQGLPPLGANAGQVGGAILNGGAAQQVGQRFTLETMKALGNTFTHDPKVTSDCAVIAHAILTSLGLQLQKSPIAKDLMDNALKAGWRNVQAKSGNLQVGDLLTFQGAGYGARMYDPTTGRYLGVRSKELMRRHPNAVGYHSGVFAGYDAQGRMQITENPGSTRTQTRTLTAGELNNVIALRAPNSPWGAQGVYTVSNNRPMGGGSASNSGSSPRPATPTRTPAQRAQALWDQLQQAEDSRNATFIALVNGKIDKFKAEGNEAIWKATQTANKSSGGRSGKPTQTPQEREQAAQAEAREMDQLRGWLRSATTERLQEIVNSDVGPNLSLAKWQMAGQILEERQTGRPASRRSQTPQEQQQAARARQRLEDMIGSATTERLEQIAGSPVGPDLSFEKWELATRELERRQSGRGGRQQQTPAQQQAADRARDTLEDNLRAATTDRLEEIVGGTVGKDGLTYEKWQLADRILAERKREAGKPTQLQTDQATAQATLRTEALETAIRSASPARLQEIVAGGVTPEVSLDKWQMARDELKRREEVADQEEEKRADAAVDRQKRVAQATADAEAQMSGYTVQQAQARAEVERGNLDRFQANQAEQLRVAGDNTAERLRILEAGADEELQIRTNLLTAQLVAGKRANEKTRQDALDAIPKDAPQTLKDQLTKAIEGAFATENTRLYTVFGDGMTEALRDVTAKTEEAGTARTEALKRETKAVRDTVEGYEDLARNAQRTIDAGEWDADAAREYARALRGLDEAAEDAGISQNELVVGAQAAAVLLGNTAQELSDQAATLLGAAAAEIASAGQLAQQGNVLGAVMDLESLVTLLEEGPQTPGTQKAISLLNDELERLLGNLTEGQRLGLENTLAAIREGPEEAVSSALPSEQDRTADAERTAPMTRELGRGEEGATADADALIQYGLDREKVRWTEEKTEALGKMTAAELAQRRAELERIGDSRALLELQMIDTLETERAATQTELLASAKAELDGLNKVSIPTWQALADKLEEQAKLGGEHAEKLREQAKALREAGEAAKKLEGQLKTLEKIQKGLDIVGDLFSRMSGGEANSVSAAMNWASGGISAYMQWMSGDWAGAISTSINMIGDLGQAILDLSPGFQKWKSDMLDVAQTQKTALGMGTGGFISPWQKQLEEDAKNREKQANAGFWQRVSWKLFGGAPQVMKTESAKLLAELQTIFAELGSGIANIFSSSMESAFLEGDMTRWAENFDKTFDEMVGKLIIKTMVDAAIQQGAVANDLANLTKAIQEQRYNDIPGILTSIKANARLALQPIADVAPSLPGYGSSKTDEQGNPVGGDLFGAAPTLQAGISHFELQLPPVILQGMTDFAASVPEFRAGVQEWRVAAAELRAALHGGVTPPRMSGNGGLV